MRIRGLIASAAVVFVAGCVTAGSQAGAGTLTPTEASAAVKDGRLAQSLTGKPGDPENGIKVMVHRQKGNCLTCHNLPVKEPFQGNIGPDLVQVATYMTEAELRARMVNPKELNPETSMPSFYKDSGYNQLKKAFEGKTILTAQEVEDVVAYLKTLK